MKKSGFKPAFGKIFSPWLALLLAGFALGGVASALYQGGTLKSLLGSVRIAGVDKLSAGMPSPPIIPNSGFARVVAAVSPSVVNISCRGAGTDTGPSSSDSDSDSDNRGPAPGEQSMASGVLVSPDGLIITNYHVIADSDDIKVCLLDKRCFPATLVGADPKTDIAVLRIKASGLPVIRWGDSDDIAPGEFVLAIGNPFGLSHTVTMGIISAVGRASVGIADYEDFIQTDAAINPGNSGGPLVDENGDVIGINTAIFSRSGGNQGIGFAVPANMVRSIMDQLVKQGKVVRGWLGVSLQDLTPELSEKFEETGKTKGGDKLSMDGALVSDISASGPAAQAGLRRGDVITGFAGKPVKDPASLKNMIAAATPGSEVGMTIIRNGMRYSIRARIGDLDSGPVRINAAAGGQKYESAFSGLGVMDLTGDISKQLGLGSDLNGVVIIDVQDGTPAFDSGLKRGDIIKEIEKKPVRDISDFKRLAARTPADEKTVLFLISRAGKSFYTTLKQGR
ncbi:MAG: Do family serine endopeptidase [Nitrospiraceae bacterium]|nr:Do family serine endopeptidase [Nitrospiraceae bacterium]